MKLRNLSGAIRKQSGNVYLGVATPLGYIRVAVQKTDLLDKLKGLSDDAQIETHMELDADGALRIPASDSEGRAKVEQVMRDHLASINNPSGTTDGTASASASDLDLDFEIDTPAPAAAAPAAAAPAAVDADFELDL